MNKTLKKVLSLVLALPMMMCFAAVVFAAEAEGEVTPEPEQHRFIFEILIDMVLEWWGMIRYIFYDVFLGVPA